MRGPRTAIKSGPHLPQLEKVLTQKRRPNTAINKLKKKKLNFKKKKIYTGLLSLSSSLVTHTSLWYSLLQFNSPQDSSICPKIKVNLSIFRTHSSEI